MSSREIDWQNLRDPDEANKLLFLFDGHLVLVNILFNLSQFSLCKVVLPPTLKLHNRLF